MPEQQEIAISGPGVDALKIEEIEAAANDYVKVRDQRMALTQREVALKTNLIQILLQHEAELPESSNGSKLYRYDELVVILKLGTPNVKVRTEHADRPEPDDEDETE